MNDEAFNIKNNTSVNIDAVNKKEGPPLDIDFKLENGVITSSNTIGVYLLKTSRTKALKIKAYQRKW